MVVALSELLIDQSEFSQRDRVPTPATLLQTCQRNDGLRGLTFGNRLGLFLASVGTPLAEQFLVLEMAPLRAKWAELDCSAVDGDDATTSRL